MQFDNPSLSQVLGAVVTIGGAFLALRKWLSSDSANRAGDSAAIALIEQLKSALSAERAARQIAEERADKFADERNQLVEQLGELRGRIEALTSEVAQLRTTVSNKGHTDEMAEIPNGKG
jgi:chromosome segregation ATPase